MLRIAELLNSLNKEETTVSTYADLMTQVQKLTDQIKSDWSELTTIKSWSSVNDIRNNLYTVYTFIKQGVLIVEAAASNISSIITSEEKKKALGEWIDSLIALPFWLEWADGPIISFLIDFVCDQLNNTLGKVWGTTEQVKAAKSGTEIIEAAESAERAAAVAEVITEVSDNPEKKLTKDEINSIIDRFRKETANLSVPSASNVNTASPTCDKEATSVSTSYSNRFLKAVQITLGFEGGYSNDSSDKGGETNYGITSSTLNSAFKAGIVSYNDVKNLTKADATKIYYTLYWKKISGDNLPAPLDLVMFDAAINHGIGGATKLLQTSLNSILSGADLVVDGGFGPKTLAAVRKVVSLDAQMPSGVEQNSMSRYLAADFQLNRTELYSSLVAADDTQKKFFYGWIHQRVDKLDEQVGLDA